MTTERVTDYFHDHLAGSRAAIELLEYVRGRSEAAELTTFAGELLAEVRWDRQTLAMIADRFGGTRTRPLRAALAWVGEKAARMRLARKDPNVALLEALEALEVGIYGKLLLWRALASFASDDPRLGDVDLGSHIDRAQDQRARVEERRLRAAGAVLRGSSRDGDQVHGAKR